MRTNRPGSSGILRRAALAVAIAVPFCAGCAEVVEERTIIGRYDEKVTEAEFKRFLEVVRRLPDGKLPELPIFFGPRPDWATSRTLPVHDLVKEENMQLAFRWDVNLLAKVLGHDRALQRSLRRSNMELEEFCVLIEAIGVSLCRTTLRPDQSLDAILEKSKVPMDQLQRDARSFSELSRDDVYDVLRRAVWITRVDRAKRLSGVPPENLALVRKHQEEILAIHPGEFKQNPFDPLADLLEEHGIPFEELPDS
ncbi:MAG: hypothetical protein AB7O26_12570, partial [Planctomycetaceae bacterium]